MSLFEETALFWTRFTSLLIIPTVVFGLHFALLFVKNRFFLLSKYFIWLVYVPAVFFELSHIVGLNNQGITHSVSWNWINDTEYSILEASEIVWISLIAFATLTFYLINCFGSLQSEDYVRKRAILITVGYLIPSLSGLAFQVVFPFVLGQEEIPLTTPTIIFFSASALIAMRRFKFLLYKPSFATDQVLEMMEEGVIIIDSNMVVKYLNSGFSKLTGYKKVEFIGKSINELESQTNDNQETFSQDFGGKILKKTEMDILIKDGSALTVEYSYSKYVDNFNSIQGVVIVLRDITEMKKANEKIKQEKRQALQYQSQLLSSQLNPHFLFNSLNSVQYYILDEEVAPALVYISDFSRLTRSVLQNSAEETIPLSDEISFLDLYLSLELRRFADKFTYSISFESEFDPDDYCIPPMLLQPYIENALVHGFGSISSGGVLKITFAEFENHFICEIEDNGVGRNKADELKKMRKKTNEHKSFSMGLIRSRIDILNEIYKTDYFVEIEDIKENGNGESGTKITIHFPKITNY